MKSFLFLLILIPSFFSVTFAQDDLASYKRAKTLIGYGNFDEAMDLLLPYLDQRKYGTLSFYAGYHFAYAAYQQGQYDLVDATLKPLLENRSWDYSEQAKYLIALSYFQQERMLEALMKVQEIEDEELYKEAEKASFHFLQNTSVSFLGANLSKFEDNRGYMNALKEQMEKQTIMSAEEKALYYELKSKKISGDNPVRFGSDNGVLDIAIILPFVQSGQTNLERLPANNFVFELYQGLEFAIDELKKNGVKINVNTYNSDRDIEKTKKILADPYLRTVDVIIGPIYPEESELVAYFAEVNKIPYINPLSNVDENFEKLNYAYLYRPSVSSISQGIIDFLKKNIQGKKIGIAFSSATRDELLSKKTSELASKNGFQVTVNQRVTDNNIRSFFQNVGITRNLNANVDAVIIFSDDPNIASPTFGLLESIIVNIPILVMDSWLYFNFATYEMFETPNIHFIGNNSIDFQKEAVSKFRELFFEENLMYPSVNAHLGYDLIYWLSKTLNKSNGFDLAKSLNQKGFQEGKITHGLDFKNSKNNTYVPVLKLENGTLEEQ